MIAHVVEKGLPYTEILTADYIMANPMSAEAYGALTEFVDPDDEHEFRPSKLVDYYRSCDGQIIETRALGDFVVDPGPCATNYPHAGVLSDKVFLRRYPTTATNRNRARSRWTYYHFLGLDVEKSASRTTDPVALADTNNPTMNNPACTVCHSVLDPVAGAFQNFGDEGDYRDQWGGLDSLDSFYKEGIPDGNAFEIEAENEEDQQIIGVSGRLQAGENSVWLSFVNDDTDGEDGDRNLYVDRLQVIDTDGQVVYAVELEDVDVAGDCNSAYGNSYFSFYCSGTLEVPVQIAATSDYEVEVATWADRFGSELAKLVIGINSDPYEEGDTWYRDLRTPGFDGKLVPDANASLAWLAQQIVADKRFAHATVKFWWPAIMGSEVSEPPEDQQDADFEGRLLASNAQAAEVERLANAFRRGFDGRPAYRLDDLLAAIVLSSWFRAETATDNDPVRVAALTQAGAKRLLTPEELARKTLALTGFQLGRQRTEGRRWFIVHEQSWSWLTHQREGYGLLYGGIDSDGITARARDLTSVMAGVAQSHALQTSCPVVMKELYLLSDEERRLFEGVDTRVTPESEFGATIEIEAAIPADREIVSVRGYLPEGTATIALAFVNNEEWFEGIDGDRNLRLDRMDLRDAQGRVVVSQELEEVTSAPDCEWNGREDDHYVFYCGGSLEFEVSVSAAGEFDLEVVAWADQYEDELAKLDIRVETDIEKSAGARAIQTKLAELFDKLHGIQVAENSSEVLNAYKLFIDVWKIRRDSENTEFFGWNEAIDCDWGNDGYYLDGIVEDAYVYRDDWGDEWGARYDWDRDRIDAHFETIDWSDPKGIAETWTVVLAYLLMDYRYLYL